ncbi:MAG TPA: glycosyltransferase, partial [Chthoniobacterales bacterium]
MSSNIICIAGAHRSGTSMLARLLHATGLALGPESDLMPAAADNPDGFWENLRFVQLNDEILNAVGAAWDLPPSDDERFEGDQFSSIRAKARPLLQQFSADSAWGWKDPRSCLTLPFWQSLIPSLKALVIVRNPLESAYSMRQRNGTSYALGLRLWEIYNRRLLTHTQSDNRLVTDYQTFFDHPDAELERIVSWLGLPVDQIDMAAPIVNQNRRHTTFSRNQLIDAGVSESVITLYDSLLDEVASRKVKTASETRLSKPNTGLPPEMTLGRDPLAGAKNQLNIAVPEAETVRQELAWRRGAEIEHHQKIEQFQAKIESLTQDLAAQNTRAALEIGRRDGRITELQTAYAHLDALLLREQAERDKLLADQSTRSAAERDKLLADQSARSAAEIALQRQDLTERLTQTNRLLHNYSVQLTAHEQDANSLRERLRKQLGETRRLIRFLEETERAADYLRKSRRWILINPFVWIAARLSGKSLRGFGHLDKVVDRFRAWQSARPSTDELERAMVALKAPQAAILPAVDPEKIVLPKEGDFEPSPPQKPIEFAVFEDVEVSVIIPVFNQIEFTQACLASLQKHADAVTFEVIVVDDCSTDDTAQILKKIPGLVYLRNKSNSGFIASCNSGVQRARGRYLLFLNNDTVVSPNWMARLRETFDLKPRAGLVGSKLIYPDGRLQEAGGIIWRDGSGWNRGKFQDAGKPEYNFLREVDYCSAASVMIPKPLFTSLGGFDAKYDPAYYEDVDLAFKVAQSGRKVLYQPLSVITHCEGITGGTDISTGTKKHQEINRSTFTSSWSERLATKPVNGDLAAWERLPANCLRILVIDHHLPMTDRDAGSMRMFYILSTLQELGHRVTFLPDNVADIPPYGDALRKRGVEVAHYPYCKSVADFLERTGDVFDIVILSRCDFARKHIANVRRFSPSSRVIFDTVDLHHLRLGREAILKADASIQATAEEKERQEFELVDATDQTWVVSGYEQSILRERRPLSSVEVVPTIVETPGSHTPFDLRHDLLFIGSFQHPPNVDAALYFAREIFPLVLQRLPKVRFYVIGDKAPPSLVALASESIV